MISFAFTTPPTTRLILSLTDAEALRTRFHQTHVARRAARGLAKID
jgi:hypothetical protein